MKVILLNKGYTCLVDDSDYEYLNKFKWSVVKYKNGTYAVRCIWNNKKTVLILMHRQILNVTNRKILVDHKDHNGLNNQKNNIRLCTNSQNQKNKKPRGTSMYLGVSYSNIRMKWVAQININGKQKGLGRFDCEIDAAKKYDEYALLYHKEFANLNFK